MKYHRSQVCILFFSSFLSFWHPANASSKGVAIPSGGEVYQEQNIQQVAIDLMVCVRERLPRFLSISRKLVRNGSEPDQQRLTSNARQLIYYGNDRMASGKTVTLLTNRLFQMHPNGEPLMVSDGKVRHIRVYLNGYERALGNMTPDGKCVCSIVLPTARISPNGDFVEEEPLVSEKFVVHMKATKIVGITTAAQIEMEAPFALALKVEAKVARDWLSDTPKERVYTGPRWISAKTNDKAAWYQSAVSDWKTSLARSRGLSTGK